MNSSGIRPGNRKPADYMRKSLPVFKPIIKPSCLGFLDNVKGFGILRSGWIPQKPQHYIYQQRVNSATTCRHLESPLGGADGLPLDGADRFPPVGEDAGRARPRTAHPILPLQAKIISLDPIEGNSCADIEKLSSSRIFFSTRRVKHVHLPSASPPGRLVRSASCRPVSVRPLSVKRASYRPVSECSERYLTTRPANICAGRRVADSEQSRRLEEEWASKEKCRLLKRMSEVRDYRVDRLYYINGISCQKYAKQPATVDKRPVRHSTNRQSELRALLNHSGTSNSRSEVDDVAPRCEVDDVPRSEVDDVAVASRSEFDEASRPLVTSEYNNGEGAWSQTDGVFLTQNVDESRDPLNRQNGFDVAEVESVELGVEITSDDDSVDDPGHMLETKPENGIIAPPSSARRPQIPVESEVDGYAQTNQKSGNYSNDATSHGQNVTEIIEDEPLEPNSDTHLYRYGTGEKDGKRNINNENDDKMTNDPAAVNDEESAEKEIVHKLAKLELSEYNEKTDETVLNENNNNTITPEMVAMETLVESRSDLPNI